ncbi:hypothetical protein San01_42320 [Streptomyces angustmyceticus]|uniref:Uncharacterized protein n=1 Tax=Streptomyces angustmyceticus TaxID=285578 RepID=A0A5J4LN33_9ACTN|nr:hypothetical protein San01_42320 [Streptomyces angustmyceticus]
MMPLEEERKAPGRVRLAVMVSYASDWEAVNNIEPLPGNQPFDYYAPSDPYRSERHRDGSAARRSALIIHTIADIAAVFLGLWILLYLLEANRANVFVGFVQGVADFLAWWSQDIFTMDAEGFRVFLNYGLPAVIYLLVGHGIAARLRRL